MQLLSATAFDQVRSELPFIDPTDDPPDLRVLRSVDPQICLEHRVLPWRAYGERTVLLTPDPDRAAQKAPMLHAHFGDFSLAKTGPDAVESTIQEEFQSALAHDAETALGHDMSCRGWNADLAFRWFLGVVICVLALIIVIPSVLFAIATGWVIIVLFCSTALKLGALLATGSKQAPSGQDVASNDLPSFSLLVPLFKEKDIAEHLILHLNRLDYPKHLLDVCLIVESDDVGTIATLGSLSLPSWMRVITAPEGQLRTKPRALNYALAFARGSIIGVYDAEDAPEPGQLRTVAQTFAESDPSVACVQGNLDYYNAASNWLARCFALEYASWFRVVLPGYARLGLLVPLGGTTLFFRRDVLQDLGAWDAHNVTEDADLGVRLARKKFRTVFMQSVTLEEANARVWPWIRQRSRWLKGYGVTYAVHMRAPLKLLKDLGIWRFFGFQILFLGTLSQFLTAPLLWSVIVIPFGLPHPILDLLGPMGFLLVTGFFLCSAAVNLAASCLGAHRAGKPWLMKWAPTMVLYFPLGTVGALKGLAELLWKPFYWDKTAHGVDVPR